MYTVTLNELKAVLKVSAQAGQSGVVSHLRESVWSWQLEETVTGLRVRESASRELPPLRAAVKQRCEE
jgi:hypothetical protein